MVEVDVWNMATSLVRARPVQVTTEDTPQAQACRAHSDVCARMILSVVPWTFATRWEKLHHHLTDVAPEGLFALSLPAGAIKVWGARTTGHPILSETNDPTVEFEVNRGTSGTRTVFTNVEDAEFEITKMMPLGVWPASLQEAFSYLLASKIAIPLAGVEQGRFLRREYSDEYLRALDRAQTEDAGPNRLSRRESKYITGRR